MMVEIILQYVNRIELTCCTPSTHMELFVNYTSMKLEKTFK